MDILYYSDRRGCQQVNDWIQHIKKHEKALYRKFYNRQVLLSKIGKALQSRQRTHSDIKQLKGTDDIWQLRVNDDRILFFFSFDTIVMTNQFRKKQDDTPQSEIDRAEKRKEDWLKNN